ncbi:ribosome-associated translation inhibitor RaiA [bacterium]|nr:ribosome-associated translation inhibitor RaiA [bacterium]
MQVLVTFRHMDATPALRRYAETKVQRVHKLMRRPIEAHVILEVSKRRHIAEITLSGEHLHITAKEATADLYSAIDLAMDKVERQIQKHVSKRLAHRHDGPPPEEPVARKRATTPTVARERVTVEPMRLAEAVRRLARDGGEYLLFQNEKTEVVNLLVRRRDGSLALVEPEVAGG